MAEPRRSTATFQRLTIDGLACLDGWTPTTRNVVGNGNKLRENSRQLRPEQLHQTLHDFTTPKSSGAVVGDVSIVHLTAPSNIRGGGGYHDGRRGARSERLQACALRALSSPTTCALGNNISACGPHGLSLPGSQLDCVLGAWSATPKCQ
jgi:hypothetical protein